MLRWSSPEKTVMPEPLDGIPPIDEDHAMATPTDPPVKRDKPGL
jgi:hypothetical protein